MTRGRSRRWTTAAVVVAGLLLAAAVATLRIKRSAPALTERDLILLADFVNTTDEPVFDETLEKALAVHLDQSPFLNVVPDGRVRETLAHMGRSPDDRLSSALAREVGQRDGIRAVLEGSIASVGTRYAIGLDALDCASGSRLAREKAEAADKEQVLTALGAAATRLRAKLGESIASIQRFDVPLEQATTSSLEALQAFSWGELRRAARLEPQSVAFYDRAVELDPSFALAYARLGTVYGNFGESDRARSYRKKAFELKERVSAKERFYIESQYYGAVTGQIDKAIQNYELWKETYPRDSIPYNNLAAEYNVLGRFEQGLENGQQALRLLPDNYRGYQFVAAAYMGLHRLDEAKAVLEAAREKKLDGPSLHLLMWQIAFQEKDAAALAREAEWAGGKPDAEMNLALEEAQWTAARGQMRKAREQLAGARALAEEMKLPGYSAHMWLTEAVSETWYGNAQRAGEAVEAAMALTHDLVAAQRAARILAEIGNENEARALASEAAQWVPTDTLTQSVWLPVLGAVVELRHGQSEKAIQLMEKAIPYDRARPGIRRVRCQAYLQAGRAQDAVYEIEQTLALWPIDPTSPVFSVLRLDLARAHALAGDTAASRQAYRDLLELWNEADPELPLLHEAREEYARLP